MIELHFFDFLKHASPTQCSTCIVKCTFRKCNAPFPSATVMSQLDVQSRPVHILTFLILLWLRSVFEADFHTGPKTKQFFLIG